METIQFASKFKLIVTLGTLTNTFGVEIRKSEWDWCLKIITL